VTRTASLEHLSFARIVLEANVLLFNLLGKPQSHEEAKEIMAGFAGAFIDREVETKGLDFIDREKAKRHSQQHIDEVSGESLGF
jgi:hypothetical protein